MLQPIQSLPVSPGMRRTEDGQEGKSARCGGGCIGSGAGAAEVQEKASHTGTVKGMPAGVRASLRR